MRRLAFICLLLFTIVAFFPGCTRDRPPIPVSKMEAIIMDVQTAEIYSTIAGKDSTKDYVVKNQDSLAAFYASIFKHYGITPAQFNTAIDWYRAHPSEMDSIYVQLLPQVDNLDVGHRRR